MDATCVHFGCALLLASLCRMHRAGTETAMFAVNVQSLATPGLHVAVLGPIGSGCVPLAAGHREPAPKRARMIEANYFVRLRELMEWRRSGLLGNAE